MYDNVTVSINGRRKRADKSSHQKEGLKRARHSSGGKIPMIGCKHNASSSSCSCWAEWLTGADLALNQEKFYTSGNKVDQDAYILRLLDIHAAQRTRVAEEERERKRDVSTTFHVLTIQGQGKVKVCKATFCSVLAFFDVMYGQKSKTDQDKYVLKHINLVVKTVPAKSTRTSFKHFVSKNGSLIPVCSKTFCSILNVSPARVQLIAKSFRDNGTFLVEKRGGARITEKDKAVWLCHSQLRNGSPNINAGRAIMAGRKVFADTCLQSSVYQKCGACGRRNSWLKINPQGPDQNFLNNFRQDVCSYCEEKKTMIKSTKDPRQKQSCITDYMIHKVRARKFFDMVKSVPQDTVSISFDMQKNQPLPKLSVDEVYYSRQVWLYNLTCVRHGWSQDPTNVFTYTWLETESGKGSNEIASDSEPPYHPPYLRMSTETP